MRPGIGPLSPVLLTAALLGPGALLHAQLPTARGGWQAAIGVDDIRFTHSLTDTAASTAPTELRPDGRLGLRLAVSRLAHAWGGGLELGWASGRIEAGNSLVSAKDRTARVTRWRLAATLDRSLAAGGAASLVLTAAPTIDWWAVAGSDRLRAGAEARLGLRVPLGRVELENRLGVGLSGSPFTPGDAGPSFRRRAQWSLNAGMGIRFPL